jgi:anaerobic ribonucleoside-triphosphate reductase
MDLDELPQKVLSALSSPMRLDVLKLLSRQSPLTFTQIMQTINLEPTADAGRFGYHLRELKNSNLIEGNESGYYLTELGKKVIEFVWGLIDFSKTEMLKEIPVRTSEYAIEQFDRNKIKEALIREAKVPNDLADEIAKEAEEQLMKAKVSYLTAPLIREVVNSILVLKGYEQYRHNLTRLGLPPFEIQRIIKEPKIHPSNSNPEAIQKQVSDPIFEQYLLLNILPRNVADAHLRGDISIPNANSFILRPNSIQHDLRPFFLEGFSAYGDSLANSMNPPKTFYQALMLTAKIIEYSQIHSAGMQSIDFFNIFLAPYIKGLSYDQIKEQLMGFLRELGSTYIGPGGTLPLSTLNLEFEIPKFLSDLSVPGFNSTIYNDFLNESRLLLKILLDLLLEGDQNGKPFFYPCQIFKIRKNTFIDPEANALLLETHEVIMKWGTPILANLSPEWQTSNANYTGQFDRLDSSWKEDFELDTLRTGNLDHIFINLPRIAYESKQNDATFLELLNQRINLAVSALTIKRNQLFSRLFEDHLLPLFTYQIKAENYFRLEHATNAIGYIGLPEAIEIHTNSKINTKNGLKFAQKVLQNMQELLRKNTETTGYRWVLRQAYSETWIDRLVQLDNKKFSQDKEIKARIQFNFYNTNNINSDLTIPWPERIRLESNFHKLLAGGHLLVLPLSESFNSINSLIEVTKKVCTEPIGLYTFAPDLTFCSQCKQISKGNFKRCPVCNSAQNINYFYKSMGVYRSFNNISKSERNEIRTRYKFTF